MLGAMAFDDRMYGNNTETACIPIEGADLAEQLKDALSHITGQITEVELDDLADEMTARASIPADSHIKNFSYALVTLTDNVDDITGERHAGKIGTGDVYFRENSRMYPVDMPAATLERVKGMIGLRDATQRLIQYQLDDYPDHAIQRAQGELNRLYDAFTRKHGLINHSANGRAFMADSSYYLLCSLEILDENNNLARKSDMFTKRTIKQKNVITSVDTSVEALAVSIGQKARVDIDFMAQLTGFTPEKVAADLHGIIFLNPATRRYEPADEYLSGNVRDKLFIARETAAADPAFAINVSALEQAQPKELEASEISVRLGATWIER
jgi:N12 class adenine-specific DNA methylase